MCYKNVVTGSQYCHDCKTLVMVLNRDNISLLLANDELSRINEIIASCGQGRVFQALFS